MNLIMLNSETLFYFLSLNIYIRWLGYENLAMVFGKASFAIRVITFIELKARIEDLVFRLCFTFKVEFPDIVVSFFIGGERE